MYFDAISLAFSPFAPGTPQAITTTAQSTVVDVTGAGSGNAPNMIGAGGVNTALGFDMGAGRGGLMPYVGIFVTVAGTTSNTLTVTLAAAPDNGSYAPGTYETLYVSRAIAGTALTLGSVLYFPVPPTLSTLGDTIPRFYRLTYTCSGTLSVTVSAAIIPDMPSLLTMGKYGNNFIAL